MLLQQVIYPAAPPGAAASTHTVPLDQPATAGSTLIILAAAPAVITIPGAIKRGTNVSNADVSIFSMDMAGGETSIQVNLSGPRRLQAVVLERDDIDAFITAVGRNQAPSGSWAFNALAMNEGDHVFVALGAIHHISLAGEAVGPGRRRWMSTWTASSAPRSPAMRTCGWRPRAAPRRRPATSPTARPGFWPAARSSRA
ncbi:hypothetical protein [Thermocatellispora tengchongensis]|uniref:hypothetical protein n=1 Tax=Thermocatellispora tengchongensis TaxID=1073253 RepID=UPI003635C7F7